MESKETKENETTTLLSDSDRKDIISKLEQNEKIIQIFCESLSHFRSIDNDINNNNDNNDNNDNDNNASDEHNHNQPKEFNGTAILKLFCKQLSTLNKCNKIIDSDLYKRHPSLRIWLKIINISSRTFNLIHKQGDNTSFYDLYQKNDQQLEEFLKQKVKLNEQNEINCIVTAFATFRKCCKLKFFLNFSKFF
jgi:hypothetical protein